MDPPPSAADSNETADPGETVVAWVPVEAAHGIGARADDEGVGPLVVVSRP